MHYQLECGIVLSGRMRRLYEGYQADFDPGDVWLCGIWEPHGFQIVRAPCRCLILVINPAMLVNLRYDEAPEWNLMAPFLMAPSRRPGRGAARGEVLRLAKRMQAESTLRNPARLLFLRLRVQEMLLTLLQNRKAAPRSAMQSSVESYGRINRAVEMVFASSRYLPVQAAAESCGMSRNRFGELFRRLMGISFPEFAVRHRVSGAAKQLLASRDPLKAVAQDWGFTDASHLHRSFRKYYGCRVSEYRRRSHGILGDRT
jgi:AraC-like DNA-binding protein